MTWLDEKRTDADVRCRLEVGPTWAWQWWLPHAHTVRTAPDEDAAKAAALAALDAWLSEIVDARRAVAP